MRPSELCAAVTSLAETLTAAGVPTATDPTTIPVPGAWITIDKLTPETLAGGYVDATATVVLIARDVGHMASLAALADLYERILDAGLAASPAIPEMNSLPGHPAPLPSFRFTLPLEI